MIRILMASIVDPSVQLGGAWTVTRGLVQLLRDGPLQAEVEIVSARRRSQGWHLIRQCAAVSKSIVTGRPAKIEFSRDRHMLSDVERWLHQQRFDLVVLNGTDLLWLLPHLPDRMKRVLVAHNIEHQLFAAQLQWQFASPNAAVRVLRKDCERLRRYEADGLREARDVIFLSSADAQYARAQWPELRTIILPPIFDGPPARRRIRRPGDDTLNIGMLANFDWWPNRQGLDWFVREVLPHLSPRIRFHLFGHRSIHVAPRHPRVVAHGSVEPLDGAWAACDFMICPILSGSGVSIKMAEAVYRMVPVLGTRFAARGLPLDRHRSIVLLDEAASWRRCLNDEGLDLARQTVPAELSARFRIDTHAGAVSDFLLDVINRPRDVPERDARVATA